MIITIIALSLLLISIIIFILTHNDVIKIDLGWITITLYSSTIIALIFMPPMLIKGYRNLMNDDDMKDRYYYITLALKYERNDKIIADAIEFNNKILEGNSYWYRFTIEDRSSYLIQI